MKPVLEHCAETSPGSAESQPVVGEYIGVKPGYCGGKPHILGHRIKVQHVVVWYERMGLTPTEIVVSRPTIRLAQVHAALAYYYDHQSEIDSDIAADDRFAAEIEAKHPSRILEKARRGCAENDTFSP